MNDDHANKNDIARKLQDVAKIEEILTEIGRRIAAEHAATGRKMPVWRDNQVVWEIPTEEVKPDQPSDQSR